MDSRAVKVKITFFGNFELFLVIAGTMIKTLGGPKYYRKHTLIFLWKTFFQMTYKGLNFGLHIRHNE